MYMQGERENKKNRKKMFYQVFIYFSYIFWDLGSATCLQKTGTGTGFLIMTWKSRQVSLDRLFSGLFFRQDSIKRLKDRKQRFRQVLSQDRNSPRIPVLSYNLFEVLFPVF